ncbi:MAG: 30S ribosomal protein S2 [Candidatus Aenigmarchaeota archaeon]|nr:30S ribosomal protein S2 [Candidatus Aenigmarchaeota archaeon]
MAQRELLVPLNVYLSTGIHIGMIQRLKVMAPYIYKVRPDKLAVFDIQKIDERIRLAAQMLAKCEPEDILVVSRKKNGHKPVVKFAEATGACAKWGRFMPGMLTNPNYAGYLEPKVVVVTDPFADRQAVMEAFNANVPVIGLCDTYNNPQYVDLIVPLNNKGKKSVALVYWILAREYLKIRGGIKGDAEYKFSAEDFEMPDSPVVRRDGDDRRGRGGMRSERRGGFNRRF